LDGRWFAPFHGYSSSIFIAQVREKIHSAKELNASGPSPTLSVVSAVSFLTELTPLVAELWSCLPQLFSGENVHLEAMPLQDFSSAMFEFPSNGPLPMPACLLL